MLNVPLLKSLKSENVLLVICFVCGLNMDAQAMRILIFIEVSISPAERRSSENRASNFIAGFLSAYHPRLFTNRERSTLYQREYRIQLGGKSNTHEFFHHVLFSRNYVWSRTEISRHSTLEPQLRILTTFWHIIHKR